MTVEEVESETVWPFQGLRKARKPGLHVRNIATVENSSSISCFLIGTLLILEQTKSQTATTRP